MTMAKDKPFGAGGAIVCNLTMDTILNIAQKSNAHNVKLRVMENGSKEKV